MAESTPKHGLTKVFRKVKGDRRFVGWVKRVNRKPLWIVGHRQAPTATDADAYYEKHFSALWQATPAPVEASGVSIGDLADAFLLRKRERLAAGRLDGRTYQEHEAALQDFCAAVGPRTPAGDIGPRHFARFNDALAIRFGTHRRRKWVMLVRGLFKWAARPPVRLPVPDYGDEFNAPSPAEHRRERKRRREERGGLLLFTPAEIREQLTGKLVTRTRKDGTPYKPLPVRPSPFMRAAILLGVNAGLGNTDVAELPLNVIDLDGGWLDYARGKTGAERRAWLWPETRAAIREYLAVRAKPHRPDFARLLFLTTAGRPYVVRRKGKRQQDKIGDRYHALLKSLGQLRPGRNWYSLRRTARTIAAETGQERAIDLILGHAERAGDMGATYTQAIGDEVIKAVCLHVRSRIWPD